MALRPTIHGLAICAGVGMLDEGAAAGFDALGFDYRVVAYLERDGFAASTLVARMEDQALEPALVWDDLKTFPGRAFRGAVDCICAGFPCQDISVAGARAGLDGARSGLFFDILGIADDCQAHLLFLENVAGIASAGATVVDEAGESLTERAAARIVGELADRGWSAEWMHLRASDVGAAHGRERWFCFAWRMAYPLRIPDRQRPGRERVQHDGAELADADSHVMRADGGRSESGADRRDDADGCGASMGNASRHGWREGQPESDRRQGRSDLAGTGRELGNTGGERLARGGGKAMTRPDGKSRMDMLDWQTESFLHPVLSQNSGQELSPTTRTLRRRLNPAFVCWLMGWPTFWTSPAQINSAAAEMALWRSRLRSHLSSLVGEQE